MAKHFPSFRPHALDLLEHSLQWMDQYWDADASLLAMKSYERISTLPVVHHIRETSWYALGLLQRGSAQDIQRACQALQTVLKYQFNEPGEAYDGTWYRFPEEPHPGKMPIWRGYDPNWREFIGSTLAMILIDYEPYLSKELVASIDVALRKAIRGMLARGLSASYTNIALMHAFLLIFAGERLGEAAWISAGEHFAREIYALFEPHHTFHEFNAPTYYGIDFYALGLWRTYSSSLLLRKLGDTMEQALWQDFSLMYHAGMKNMAGPYDRSYGMDMQHYVSLVGMWVCLEIGHEAAPFPDLTQPFEHEHDFCFVPCCVAVDVNVPTSVRHSLLSFQGEHQVERIITAEPHRVATAWLGERLLIGGEHTSYSPPASDQLHPATIHWQSSDGKIGWVRLLNNMAIPVNARAAKDLLSITYISQGEATPDIIFHIQATDRPATILQPNYWQLADLTVQIATNAQYVKTHDYGYYAIYYSARELVAGTTIEFTLRINQ